MENTSKENFNAAFGNTLLGDSMLYKKREEVKYSVDVKTSIDGRIKLLFTCDGGKFGTDEILDEYDLSIKELLDILQNGEYNQHDIDKAYDCGKNNSTFYNKDGTVILPNNYQGVDG